VLLNRQAEQRRYVLLARSGRFDSIETACRMSAICAQRTAGVDVSANGRSRRKAVVADRVRGRDRWADSGRSIRAFLTLGTAQLRRPRPRSAMSGQRLNGENAPGPTVPERSFERVRSTRRNTVDSGRSIGGLTNRTRLVLLRARSRCGSSRVVARSFTAAGIIPSSFFILYPPTHDDSEYSRWPATPSAHPASVSLGINTLPARAPRRRLSGVKRRPTILKSN
jgi:hypothetical protein